MLTFTTRSQQRYKAFNPAQGTRAGSLPPAQASTSCPTFLPRTSADALVFRQQSVLHKIFDIKKNKLILKIALFLELTSLRILNRLAVLLQSVPEDALAGSSPRGAVLKAASVLLPQSFPGLSVSTINNNPHVPGSLLQNPNLGCQNLSGCPVAQFPWQTHSCPSWLSFFFLSSRIHKIHRFITAPSSTNPFKMLEFRVYLEKALMNKWR